MAKKEFLMKVTLTEVSTHEFVVMANSEGEAIADAQGHIPGDSDWNPDETTREVEECQLCDYNLGFKLGLEHAQAVGTTRP